MSFLSLEAVQLAYTALQLCSCLVIVHRLSIFHERQQHHLMCASASVAYPSDKPFLILKRWVAEMSSCQLLPSVDSQASDQLSIG